MLKRYKLMMKIIFLCSAIFFLSSKSFSNVLATTYEPAKPPKILSFTASSNKIKAGDSITLSWYVLNATKVEISGIDNLDYELSPISGGLKVTPSETTTYYLTASSEGGTVQASITVAVEKSSPDFFNIDYFYGSELEISLGETVTLYWKTTNAKSITIIGLEKINEELTSLPLSGELEVFPMETTDYILIAVGENYEIIYKIFTVTVAEEKKPAKINNFSTSASKINKGESVILLWDVSEAKSVTISGYPTDYLPLNGKLTVTPKKTTTYVLEAIGYDGVTVKKEVTVTVIESNVEDPLKLDYVVHDWGDEYIMDVDITNLSNDTVDYWSLLLKKSEFDISIIWGATLSENDEYYIISPLYYNDIIKPGVTVSFGFQAYDSPKKNFFYEFLLD